MENSKQLSHQATDSKITPIKFWGTNALGVIGIVAIGFKLVAMLQLPGVGVVYIAMGLYALTIAAGIAVILLTLRGRQDLGAQLSIYMIGLVFAISPVVDKGRTLQASLSLITISGIVILQLLPKPLRLKYAAIVGATLVLMWALEWINPSWRLQTEVGTVGPATAIIFGIILAVILLRQAWGGNIRVKIITAFTVVALISLGILGTVIYFNYRNQMREDIRQRLLNIISLTALQQDGDLFATIQTTADMQSDAYQKMQAVNARILSTDRDLAYIFSVRVNDEGKMAFVIDSGLEEGYVPLEVGVVYEDPSALLNENALTLNHSIVEEDFYTDKYGTFLSAYAPFYRSDGTRAGIVGVDIFADHVIARERNVLYLILGTTAAAMVFVTLSGLFLGNVFAKPLINLSHVAHAITEGNLGARAEVETTDELGDLAKAFNMMTSQLQATLHGLEQRVADRTRNLELAAEVGRAVSQVRALDVMLKDAAEIIRSRFDLYYVQVYLTNPSQTALILKAGTGNAGEQLLARGHQLALNGNSINGRAAVEKRSVVISETAASASFHPNPLLPDTQSEMAVPLIIGGKVVGVLDMQSAKAGALSEESLVAFEALAAQLAVAIQNANLLAETVQARAELEAQAKRVSRANWADYLDAIHKPEEIGVVFQHDKVMPLTEELEPKENTLVAPISILGENLGNLVVELDGQSSIADTKELVDTVARQVSLQVEELRLIDSAERYRLEAEETARRTTIEGWKNLIESRQEKIAGYMYDSNEVKALHEEPENSALTMPILVRDEAIGKFSLQEIGAQDDQSLDIAKVVVERLGAHIENLRLYDQSRSALMQSEKLFEASSQLTQATNLQELVASTVTTLNIPAANRALLTTFQYGPSRDIEQLTIIGNWWNGSGHEVTPIGTRYPREVMRVMTMFVSPVPVFFNDTWEDERIDASTMEIVKRLNLRSVAVLPLFSTNRQIGALVLEGEEPHKFSQQEIRLFSSLAPQIATILENRQQYEQAQRQAEREAMLNVINQKIQSATSVEAVLQIAARELGHALGAPLTIAQLGLKSNGNGQNSN